MFVNAMLRWHERPRSNSCPNPGSNPLVALGLILLSLLLTVDAQQYHRGDVGGSLESAGDGIVEHSGESGLAGAVPIRGRGDSHDPTRKSNAIKGVGWGEYTAPSEDNLEVVEEEHGGKSGDVPTLNVAEVDKGSKNIPEVKESDFEGADVDKLGLAFSEAKNSYELSSQHLRGHHQDGKDTAEELQTSPAQTLSNENILTAENWEIVRNSVLLSRTADSLQPSQFDMTVDENHRLINLPRPAPSGTYGINGSYPQGGDGFEADWEAWYDGDDDVTVVGSKGGLCYVAFRSTTFTWSDWMDNFELRSQRMKDQCDVPFGFYKGWENNYSDPMKQKLMSCAYEKCASTNGQDCIVIAGFSQGGSIAGVATVGLSHMKPKMTVVFGTPRSLQGSCNDFVDPDRYIRFCNTRRDKLLRFGMVYDIACSVEMPLWTSLGDFGHHFILPPDDESLGMQYYGRENGGHAFKGAYRSSEPHALTGPESYPSKIIYLADNSDDVTATGFENEQRCNRDHHCKSERCAGYICKEKLSKDSVCQSDWHCQSGRCASTIPWMCRDLLDVGDGCGNSEDCKSGLTCAGGFFGMGKTCRSTHIISLHEACGVRVERLVNNLNLGMDGVTLYSEIDGDEVELDTTGMAAAQSSTESNNEENWGALNPLDKRSHSQTQHEDHPWWEIKFGAVYVIRRVLFSWSGSMDNVNGSHAKISLLDCDGNIVKDIEISMARTCGVFNCCCSWSDNSVSWDDTTG